MLKSNFLIRKFNCTLCVLFFLISPLFLVAQQKQISGIVKSDAGEPLANVSVMLTGSKVGTTTDALGKYKLTVSIGDELVFSSSGFSTQKIKVDQRDEYLISLKISASTLDDVVVVGYGSQKKVNF
jgi:co-chaperonin GroES (HSP10)